MVDYFHIDAATFNQFPIESIRGKVIVECEGVARPEYFESTQIASIIFQSKYAGRFQLDRDKAQLIYPAIRDYGKKSKVIQSGKPITLLAVGFGSFIKGFDVAFKIYKALRNQKYDVRLVIAGSFGHNFNHYPEVDRDFYNSINFDEIQAEAALDPNLIIRPVSRDELLNELYPDSDILLHFSRMETFGFTLLEALNFGIPVVTVNFKAIPEIIQHGYNGFLCDPFQWDGVSAIDELKMNTFQWQNKSFEQGMTYVTHLINNKHEYEVMSKNATASIQKFSIEMRANALKKVYERD
ncbi:glycosyltransferase family 4 protein [Mongoliitalea lutea]|nr:glycosyltransferase family 4 protein [Mongoliitalea lutea]